MRRLERIDDVHGRKCPACGSALTALASRIDILIPRDAVRLQQQGTLECPNGHDLPHDWK